MVAAGVYLLVRTFELFTADALLVVAITGTITTLIGALAALSQYDIKKILAYSTMSQLGLMVLAIGMGVTNAAVFKIVPQAVPEAVGGAAGWVGGLGAFGGFAIPPMMAFAVGDLGPRGYSIGFVVFVYLAISALLMAWILKYAIEAAPANGPSRLES